MKRIICFLLMFGAIFLFSATPSYAKETVAEDFLSDFRKILPNKFELDEGELISGVGVDFLFSEILSSVTGEMGEIASFALLIFGLGLLLLLAEMLSLENHGISSAMRSGCGAIGTLLIFSSLKKTVFSVSESLDLLSDFFSCLIPIFSGISLASGHSNSSAVQAVNMSLTLGLVEKICSGFLLPMVFASFAFTLLSGVSDETGFRFARGMRSLFLWVLGILSTLLLASVSMQSTLAGARDSSALRAARYAVQGMIPVVGSTVSGALATVSGALSEARTIIGVGAVSVIFIAAASPLAVLLLYRFALSLAISFFEFLGSSSFGLFSAFRASLDSLIAVYVMSSLVYLFEIVIFLKGGAAVFV